jgi:hypothetical protein
MAARKKFKFDFDTFLTFYDRILGNGLADNLTDENSGTVCIEAAVCLLTEGRLADDPKCVTPAVAVLKINLNDDGDWFNEKERADGLRILGIAQIGSKDVITDKQFEDRLTKLLTTYAKSLKLHFDDADDKKYFFDYNLSIEDLPGTIQDIEERLTNKKVDVRTDVILLVVKTLLQLKSPGALWLKKAGMIDNDGKEL